VRVLRPADKERALRLLQGRSNAQHAELQLPADCDQQEFFHPKTREMGNPKSGLTLLKN